MTNTTNSPRWIFTLLSLAALLLVSQAATAAEVFVEADLDRDGVGELHAYADVAAGQPALRVWALADGDATLIVDSAGLGDALDAALAVHGLSFAEIDGAARFVLLGDLAGDGGEDLAIVGDEVGLIPWQSGYTLELIPVDVDLDGSLDLVMRAQ